MKLRVWHFLFMPKNAANVLNGKRQLTRIAEKFSGVDKYFVVYQYGKSGSSSVSDYFSKAGLTTIHSHSFNDKVLKMNELLSLHNAMPINKMGSFFFTNARYRAFHAILKNSDKSDIRIFISLREPEAYLKSMYCQYWDWFSVMTQERYKELTPESFCQLFMDTLMEIEQYIDENPTQSELEDLIVSAKLNVSARLLLYIIYNYIYWFENELFSMFDVSETELKYENDFWSFQNKNIKGVVINQVNVSSDKVYAEFYSFLKANMDVSNIIINLMKNSFSYKKFYNKDIA